jgi:hypothetical protein
LCSLCKGEFDTVGVTTIIVIEREVCATLLVKWVPDFSP